MNESRSPAASWKAIDQDARRKVGRDSNIDSYFAEFENVDGKKVRVEITAQDLRDFGQAPNNERAAHTERVLRAIVNEYSECCGDPPAKVNAKDLGRHLESLKMRFSEEKNA